MKQLPLEEKKIRKKKGNERKNKNKGHLPKTAFKGQGVFILFFYPTSPIIFFCLSSIIFLDFFLYDRHIFIHSFILFSVQFILFSSPISFCLCILFICLPFIFIYFLFVYFFLFFAVILFPSLCIRLCVCGIAQCVFHQYSYTFCTQI